MVEKLTLVFKDGVRFTWKVTSIWYSRKAIKLQKKHGDPVDIIGDGKVACLLREKYALYKKNPEAYKSDVLGTASQLSSMAKEEVEEKFKKACRKIGFKKG